MPPDSCFARQRLRRSITILAVCGGSSGRPEPRRLSRVRTLRSLSTEESEPCTPFLMDPRAPEVAWAVDGAVLFALIAPHRLPYAPDDRYGSNSGLRRYRLNVQCARKSDPVKR